QCPVCDFTGKRGSNRKRTGRKAEKALIHSGSGPVDPEPARKECPNMLVTKRKMLILIGLLFSLTGMSATRAAEDTPIRKQIRSVEIASILTHVWTFTGFDDPKATINEVL